MPIQPTNYQLPTTPKIAFFGTPELVVPVLDELKAAGLIPSLIVTAPDRPKGRGLALSPPPAKIWAEQNGVNILQPEKLDKNLINDLRSTFYDLFLIVAYGKIIPREIIDLPKFGTFNIHYSLLPKYRGAAPVETAILNGDKETGVSIQKMVFELDAGPVVAEEKTAIGENETAPELRDRLNTIAKKLLVETMRKIVDGTAAPREQNHKEATSTKKITKENGLIDLNSPAGENWRKYRAYFNWPGTYFFTERKGKKVRIIIKDAGLENGEFKIKRVLPEGGREISYEDFLRGL